MGRSVKRVPLDFNWPLDEVWSGYVRPDLFDEKQCEECDGSGYSPRARELYDLWYGNVPFRPSVSISPDAPAVREFAERNVARSPDFYGSGEYAIRRESRRLAALWNGQWCHHLNDADVSALVEAGRLWDLTHHWTQEQGWHPKDPFMVPSAAEVNTWSLKGFGHDSINASVVVRARCAREGVPERCTACGGHGSMEVYPGQRAESEAWECAEPPEGEGWQLWETVSEGSPISPVFPDAEGLARWLTTWDAVRGAMTRPMTIEQARGFVREGWAPSFVANAGGVHEGAEFMGTEAALRSDAE